MRPLKAAACLVEDREALLAFFAYPAGHWRHPRTTNPIESPFSTVRLRQRVTKGAGLRTKGPAAGVQAAGHGATAVAPDEQGEPVSGR